MFTAAPPPDSTLAAALHCVRAQCGLVPQTAIILGSGLGDLADQIIAPIRIDYSELPGFSRPTAVGHRGQLILGTLDQMPVVAMAGRMHRYEGHHESQLTFPVRLMAALGATALIVSNAAGGLNPRLNVGDIVVIDDHIDLAKSRLPPMSLPSCPDTVINERSLVVSPRHLYDRQLAQMALHAARVADFVAVPGTYIATLGPTYETRAEYRMMRCFGGDVVGMSTAPEVRMAVMLGMRVLGLSVVSNVARPDAPEPTDHHDVLVAGHDAGFKLRKIVAAALKSVSQAT